MKKAISLCLVLVFVLSIAGMSAFAATKSDVLEAVKATKFAKYIAVDAENVIRSMDLDEQQCDKLIEIIKDVDTYLVEDKGPTVDKYTKAEYEFVMAKIEEACKVANVTYDTVPASGAHDGNVAYRVKNAAGEVIFVYDGDAVKQTGGASSNTGNNIALCIATGVVLLIGCALSFKKSVKA